MTQSALQTASPRTELKRRLNSMTERQRRAFLRHALARDLRLYLQMVVGFRHNGRDLLDGEPSPMLTAALGEEISYGAWLSRKIQNLFFEWLESPRLTRQIMMLPRGHMKSSVTTQGAAPWMQIASRITTGRELRIGLFSGTDRQIDKFSRNIKRLMERRAPFLSQLWPDIFWRNPRKQADKWTDRQMDLIRSNPLPESAIESWSLNASPVGSHYDVIIVDDAVFRDNAESEAKLLKTKEDFELLYPILDNRGLIIVIGTRYHYLDLYGDLLKSDAWRREVWRAFDADGNLLFPDMFTMEIFEEYRDPQGGMGEYKFNCQYLLEPTDPENMLFDPIWLREWDGPIPEGSRINLSVDPNTSQRKGADYTCIMVRAVTPDGDWIIVDGLRDRLDDIEMRCRMALDLAHKWNAEVIQWEAFGFAKSDVKILNDQQIRRAEEARQKNIKYRKIPVVTTPVTQAHKNDRIARLTDRFKLGKIFTLPSVPYRRRDGREHDLREELQLEMYQFPMGEHDDILDALQFGLELDWSGREPKRARTEPEKHVEKAIAEEQRRLAGQPSRRGGRRPGGRKRR